MATEYRQSSNGRSDFSRKRRYVSEDQSPFKRGLYDKVRGIKFLVPEYAAGAIIGKGGRNITMLKDKFGAHVKMSPGRDFFPNTEERVCLVSSDLVESEQLIACFQHVCNLIREEPEDTDRKRRRDGDRRNQVKLLLTNNTAGLIIGKGGETIKSIQEQTGTRIMITPFDPDLDERVCSIAADDYENTLRATDHILDKVIRDSEGHVSRNLIYGGGGGGGGSHETYGGGFSSRGRLSELESVYDRDRDRRRGYDRSYSPSRHESRRSYSSSGQDTSLGGNVYVLDDSDPNCMVLGIVEQFVGGIVGRNGATISEIQAVSHTHIQISHKDEYIPGTRDRKIIIKGESQAVTSAYLLVLEKVSEFTERRKN